VQTARSLTEGEGLVIAADQTKVDPGNEGKLVHISGELATKLPLTDPEFGVSTPAARLVRTVELYQWKEDSRTETKKNLGGSEDKVTTYTYTQVWSEPRIDSGRFHDPGGHENPQLRYRHFEVAARDATLGAFRPGEAVLRPWRQRTNSASIRLPRPRCATASAWQRSPTGASLSAPTRTGRESATCGCPTMSPVWGRSA
jgi:hypothetical protein